MFALVVVAVAALLLASCEGGFTSSGSSSTSRFSGDSGWLEASYNKANGSVSLALMEEVESTGGGSIEGAVLEVDVTLAVGAGSFTIELLGEDDAVTLTLEASDGEAVSGHGQCVFDVFGDARYRVTAVEAENVEYRMEYRFQ
jgi:hypothetical protein